MYIIMSETFIKIDSLKHLEISRGTSLRTDRKSALQYSLFWRYANFSKLMLTIHTSMAWTLSMFLHSKYAIKVILKCTSLEKGGNFIYPMMHRFILYYQASKRTWSYQFNRDATVKQHWKATCFADATLCTFVVSDFLRLSFYYSKYIFC